jgi:hypothetical protein
MSLVSDQILKKFKIVVSNVKNDFKKQGIAVPVKNSDGSIALDQYFVIKESTGFYSIKNKLGDIILGNINLPQSAMLLANSLALGRMIDTKLYNLDQEYGFRTFEVELLSKRAHSSLKKNNVDRADFLFTRLGIAQARGNSAKATIFNSFEKLRKIH